MQIYFLATTTQKKAFLAIIHIAITHRIFKLVIGMLIYFVCMLK